MLLVLQQEMGLPSDTVPWVATPFAGGIGRSQSVCGALSGGVIAIGLSLAQKNLPRDKGVPEASQKARSLYESFRQGFGHTDCRNLTGFDFNQPGGYEAFRRSTKRDTGCKQYVSHVVKTLLSQSLSNKP